MNSKILKLTLYISVIVVIVLSASLILIFINKDNDTKTTTINQRDAIIDAINSRNKSVYQKAIDEGADLSFVIDRGPNRGRTPLEVIIEDYDFIYAQKLMQNGFDLKKVNNNHIDTITDILNTNRFIKLPLINDIIDTLIEQVADELENPDSYGFSLLMNAIYMNNTNISLTIIEKIQNVDKVYLEETALTYACSLGYVDLSVIEALIAKGANVNFKGEDGYTCLMYAVMNDDEELVRYLLSETNVDVNVKNDDGQTVLHVAIEYPSSKTIGLLLGRQDIDINVVDKNGYTPYSLACEMEDIPLTDEVESVNTCFLSAVVKENNNTVQLLLTHPKLDVNYQNANQKTALHLAIEYKNIEAIDYLFTSKDLNINIVDNRGFTPLELAQYLANENPDDIVYTNILDKLNDLIIG